MAAAKCLVPLVNVMLVCFCEMFWLLTSEFVSFLDKNFLLICKIDDGWQFFCPFWFGGRLFGVACLFDPFLDPRNIWIFLFVFVTAKPIDGFLVHDFT